MAEDFFLKRKSTSVEIDGYSKEYDSSNEDDKLACGLISEGSTFGDRNIVFFEVLQDNMAKAEPGTNPVAIVSSCLESHFSTREMSFLLAKSVIGTISKDDEK